MRLVIFVITFAIVPATSNAADSVVPKSSAVRSLIPDLRALVDTKSAIDLNAIPQNQIGATAFGGKAYATPEIDVNLIPQGFSILPLEFFLDRGDASTVRSGDRIVCKVASSDGHAETCLTDATVVARSIPLAKDPAGAYLTPSATRPATHRTFTLLIRDEDKKLFWEAYDLDKAKSGVQKYSLHFFSKLDRK